MKIYLYGAGCLASSVMKSIEAEQKNNFDVLAMLDKYQVGKKEGVDIISPESNSIDFSLPVFITIKGYLGIKEYLMSLGFKKVYDTEETFKYFPKCLYYLSEDGFMWRAKDMSRKYDPKRVELLREILEDEYSVRTLNRLVDYRVQPCAETYMEPESYTMYFPDNIPSIYKDSKLNIVDCGAL